MSSPPPPDPPVAERLAGLRDFLATCLGGVGQVTDRGLMLGTDEHPPEADLVLKAGSHRYEVTVRQIA
jgi:hypothetical protein